MCPQLCWCSEEVNFGKSLKSSEYFVLGLKNVPGFLRSMMCNAVEERVIRDRCDRRR